MVIHPDDEILPMPSAHLILLAYAIIAWLEADGPLPDVRWWQR
jgi:hypothetical protein